jgi:pimeloyl-ACP methyl ester carboxylesterase
MKWFLRGAALVFAVIVIALVFMRVPDTDAAEMRAKYGGEPSQFLTLDDGLEVHYRDEGPRDAKPLVLLHGSNADLHTWEPWVQRLSARYRVIRFDQIAHGITGPAQDDDYALSSFVADVDEVTRKLGLEQFVLAGNSMGGNIAAAFALDHPERLTGLVLIDASGAPVEREGGGNIFFTLASMPGVGSVLSTITPRSLVERSLSQSVANQEIVTDEAIDRYWELARYPGNRAATLKRFATPRSSFTAEDIATIEVPTLVMWGELDSLFPYEAANWYMEALPEATLVSYADIGHLPMEEAPDRSATDLAIWIDGILGAAAAAEFAP